MINIGISIDSVVISPNPVMVGGTFIISVEVSLITIESTHSNMENYTHNELSIYKHEDLNEHPS